MGQAESLVEADESQTDVDWADFVADSPWLGARSAPASASVTRRRLSRSHRYSTSSADSALEALLRENEERRWRRGSLHRDSAAPGGGADDADLAAAAADSTFQYPHPLYTNSGGSSASASPRHFRSWRKAISRGSHKSKSDSLVRPQSGRSDEPDSHAPHPKDAEPTQHHQNLSSSLEADYDGSEPRDFKHSSDPTSAHCVDTSHNHKATESDYNGSTSRSIGGEIDKTFAFLNSSQATITSEHTDPEDSEIHFNPSDFQTNTSTPKAKRKEDSSHSSAETLDPPIDDMETSRSRHESSGAAAAARGRQYSGSSSAVAAGASGSHHQAAAARRSASAQRSSAESAAQSASAAAASSKSSKKTSKSSKSSKKRSKSASRTRSDTSSVSDVSAASSLGSAAKKSKESTKQKIKDRLSRSGRQGSITDKWQGVVNEFQDVKKTPKTKKEEKKEQRKVSKLENMERFDNVKAVFGKGLPLPMQHGPPGMRVRDVEGETASEASTHSWTAYTPMRQQPQQPVRQQHNHHHHHHQQHQQSQRSSTAEHKQTRSYQQGVEAARGKSQSITGDRRLVTRQGRVSSDANYIKGSRAAANSSSNTTMGQHHKKGVKFQKKTGYGIEDEAVTIVDDAIRRALSLVYGKRGSSSASRMGASSRKQSSSASRKSSAASSASSSRLAAEQRKVARTNNYIRDFKSENIYRETVERDRRAHRSSSGGSGGGIRKYSIRPIPGTGRRSEGTLPPPTRPQGSLAAGGFYELDITPYGGKEKEKENQEERQQRQRRYSEGTPSRFRVGSSSQQNLSIPPLSPGPGQSIQTSSFHGSLSHINQSPTPLQFQGQSFASTQQQQHKGSNAPTISKGSVTRVQHELNEQNFAQQRASGPMFPSFRSLDGLDGDHATGTWPLTKNPPPTSHHYESTNFTSNVSENVKIDATGNYASLPGGMSMQQGPGMQPPHGFTPNWDMYSSHTLGSPDNTYSLSMDRRGMNYSYLPDPLDRPASTPAVMQRHHLHSPPMSAGPYGAYATMPTQGYEQHQRFYHSHYPPPPQPLDLHFQLQPHQSRRSQSYSNIASPVTTSPIRSMHVETGKYASTTDLADYSAYSNEPIIVADLLDKNQGVVPSRPQQMSTQVKGTSFYSSAQRDDVPAVNMGKQQTLNFYVFGDRSQSETNLHNVGDDFDVSGFYYDRERQRYLDTVDFDEYETRSEPDYNINRMREMVIHHKQTQTLPPQRKKPPVVKRIEKKEMQAYRHFPPKRPPQVHHKETTHYITKEKQIEKLPPTRFSHSAQTDLSGPVNKHKPRSKVQKYSSATQYEKPPSPPRKRDTRVEVTSRVFAPRVTETRDFFSESSRPAEPETPPGKEVPVSWKQSPEENVVTIIESFNQEPPPPARRTEVQTTSSREVAVHESDSDSEMELIETVEVEEKEQRIAMAIFEEVEFHVERTKDGKTEVLQSGKGTDLLPFEFPGKYEATVDRRKQKSIQVRENTKEGSHKYEYDANVNRHLPAPNYHSAIEMKNVDEGDGRYPPEGDGRLPAERGGTGNYPGNMESLIFQTQNMNLHNSNREREEEVRQHQKRKQQQASQQQQRHHESVVQNVQTSQPIPLPVDHGSRRGRQIRVIERSQTGGGVPHSGSSGYSSSDTASSAAATQSHSISAGGPFEMPAHDESDEEHDATHVYKSQLKDVNLTPSEGDAEESEISRSTRFVSRFDPDNVYFTVPEWTSSSNEIYHFDKHGGRKVSRKSPTDNESLPESLPEVPASPDFPDGKRRVNKKQQQHADTPKLRTRVVQDEKGNLMKITEVEKTVTKTEEFTDGADDAAARKLSASSEQLRDGEYMEMNVAQITEGQNVQEQYKERKEEIVQSSDDDDGDDDEEVYRVGPEVVGETTITRIPVEYDEQTTSLGIKDDNDHNFDEQKYLYDMRTATLSPVVTQDGRSGAMLMQYGYNDMMTEL